MGGWRSDGLRRRVAAGSPNWWVILAVSLALMALLVATAGVQHPPHASRVLSGAAARDMPPAGTRAFRGDGPPSPTSARGPSTSKATTLGTAATTSTTVAPSPGTAVATLEVSPSPLTQTTTPLGSSGTTIPTSTTTTTAVPTIPTTDSGSVAAGRTVTPGYLDPPLQSSNPYSITVSGAMQITVEWTGDTYLTMSVTCPSGDQSVGGSSAMQAFLAAGSGNCTATVSEPSSENVPLTYTMTIGPAGG